MTNCSICKRPLTDKESIDRGMGPICAGHQFRDLDITARENFSDEYDNEIPFAKGFVMKRAGKVGATDVARTPITNVPHLVVHHSPDGFEFGYGGSGPADLALNACQLYLTMTGYVGQKTKCFDGNCWSLAWALHQDFKKDFVAGAPHRGSFIDFSTIDAWFREHVTAEMAMQYAESIFEFDE